MTRSYWQKLQDLIRNYAHSHAMYHHMRELGKELGRNNQAIPKDQVKNQLALCKINDVDYILTGLFRGHHEGLTQWRKTILQEQRQARIKNQQKEIDQVKTPSLTR